MGEYDIAPPDMSGLQALFGDEETRKRAMEQYAASSPEEKALTETVASAVAQRPEAIPKIAEAAAPNGIAAVTGGTPSAKLDLNDPGGDHRRERFMASYEARKRGDQGEYDSKVAEADKGREGAKWGDFANSLITAFGRVGAGFSGDKDSDQFIREQGAKNAGAGVAAIDAKKTELMKWLKERQKTGSDDYKIGLGAIDSEEKNKLENRKLNELTGYHEGTLGLGNRGLDIKEKELARKAALASAHMAQHQKDSEAKAAAAIESQKIPFMDGHFQPMKGVPIEKAIFADTVKHIQVHAEAEEALGQLRKQAEYVVAHPDDTYAKDEFDSLRTTTMALLSNATGQGAMSDDERKQAANTVGDVRSPRFWADQIAGLFTGDQETHSRSLRAIAQGQRMFQGLAKSRAKGARLEYITDNSRESDLGGAPQSSGPGSTTTTSAPRQPARGMVTLVRKSDGVSKLLDKATAEAIMAGHPNDFTVSHGK